MGEMRVTTPSEVMQKSTSNKPSTTTKPVIGSKSIENGFDIRFQNLESRALNANSLTFLALVSVSIAMAHHSSMPFSCYKQLAAL